MKTLKDLFEHQLKDLFSAENQLIDALPKVANKASDSKLKKAFENHLEETKEQKKRLQEICDELEISRKGETCKAMKGLISETESFIEEAGNNEIRMQVLLQKRNALNIMKLQDTVQLFVMPKNWVTII